MLKNNYKTRVNWVEVLCLLIAALPAALIYTSHPASSGTGSLWGGVITALIIYIILTLVFKFALSPKVLNVSWYNTSKKVDYKKEFDPNNMNVKAALTFFNLIKPTLMAVPAAAALIKFYVTHETGGFMLSLAAIVALLFLTIIWIIMGTKELVIYREGKDISRKELLLNYIAYYNPEDSRVFVEKRIGIGTTVNLATRGGKFFMIFILGIPIVIILVIVLIQIGK